MKHLFIEGAIGLGKSELIRQALLPVLSETGGFFVQRILVGGRCVAFSVNPVSDSDTYLLNRSVEKIGEAERVFLSAGADGKWRADKDVFERQAIAALESAVTEKKRLILLDEIGGIDRDCPAFIKALRQRTEGRIPLLGVLKAAENRRILEQHLRELPSGQNRSPGWAHSGEMDEILARPGIKILRMTEDNRDAVARIVREFIEAAVKNNERLDRPAD